MSSAVLIRPETRTDGAYVSWDEPTSTFNPHHRISDSFVWLVGQAANRLTYGFLDAPRKVRVEETFRRRMERARSDLERLCDGWAGPDAKAPSTQVLNDVDQILEAISSARNVPEVEVDEDTGNVTFRWQDENIPCVLSFVLRGKGIASVIVTELSEAPRVWSRQMPVNNENSIVRFLSGDDRLVKLLGYA